MKPSFDKLIARIAGLGVPGLVLVIAMSATGWVGGAAIVTALAALGGPLGMLGGIALLGVLVMISKGLAEYGFEKTYKAVLDELCKKGHTQEEILKKIDAYPISANLKAILRDHINRFFADKKEANVQP